MSTVLHCARHLEMNNHQQQPNQLPWRPIVGISILILFAAVVTMTYWGEDCTVEVRGLPDVLAVKIKRKCTLTLHKINKKGKTCSASKSIMEHLYESTDKLTCSLISDSVGTREDCTLKEAGFGQVEVSIQPNSRGWHKLHIEHDGEHISGSPFTVFVLKTFGVPMIPIHTISGLQTPHGITFNRTGHLIVVEYTAHRISVFTKMGQKVLEFGSQGYEPGQFYYPCDVAVDDDGNILVADKKNDRIQKFTREGVNITAVGKHGTKPGEFHFPVGIGIHPTTKKIFVAEEKNNRIQILNPDLTFYKFIDEDFNEPKDVAFDSTGKVYVADNENHRIQVFTEDGGYSMKFGKEGTEQGQFTYPSSIAIDADDILYIPELYTHRVSVFTTSGIFLHSFGTEGMIQGSSKRLVVLQWTTMETFMSATVQTTAYRCFKITHNILTMSSTGVFYVHVHNFIILSTKKK